jgi:hypothetical protein
MAMDRLAACAQTEGFALGAFTEYPYTAPAAFHALVEPMKRYEADGS